MTGEKLPPIPPEGPARRRVRRQSKRGLRRTRMKAWKRVAILSGGFVLLLAAAYFTAILVTGTPKGSFVPSFTRGSK
jgi:hypothetical protein